MWDGGQQLRKLDFPECAEKALRQLKVNFVRENSNIPGIGGFTEEVTAQLVDDFIFGMPRGKANRIPPSIIELQVLELIIKVYQELAAEKVTDAVSFAMFQALFGKISTNVDRIHSLSRLISLAINVECHLLLDSSAMWMQLQGVQTSSIQLVVESLMRDFMSLVSSAGQAKLTQLPKLSQHFSCIFISGVTTMCKFPGPATSPQSRPFYSYFLPMLTEWISSDSRLCLVSLFQAQHAQSLQPHRSALWTSPTKPNTHTPIPGLVRWATQGPMNNLASCHGNALSFRDDGGGASNKMSAVKDNYKNEKKDSDLELLWSKLHLGVLQTLAAFPTLPGAPQLEVITLADMKKIVDELVILARKCEQDEAAKVSMETGLDRMVQVIQVALATGAFRCSLADLKKICVSIPETKLRLLLESHHLSNSPPAMHNAS